MKQNKTLGIKLSLIFIIVAFTQCATNQKMNTKVPTEIKNSYF